MKTSTRFLISIFLAATLLSAQSQTSKKPNILFIFCDDLGYGDLGAYYQKQRQKENKASEPWFVTPHIDKVADEGIILHAHYCPAPVCAPSRASLFLGMHQGNAPIRNNQFDKELPNQPTLASALKQAGYHTALIGKWGLQGKDKGKDAASWPSYPTKRGFDYFLGGVRHRDGHEHYPQDKIHFKNKRTEIWEQDNEIGKKLAGCYTTDLFTAASKRWLVKHHKKTPNKPFFLFLSFDTPHAATQTATAPYPKGFGVKGGLQWLGKSGEMINTAKAGKPDSYIHPDYAQQTYDHDKDKSTPAVPWTNVAKRYASSIRRIDNAVADLVQTLKDLGYDQNTLVVFTSDHGPSKESYIRQPLKPGFFDSFGPFTGIKRDCWEGGIRPGAIVRWPKGIKAKQQTDHPSQMNDWMATLCELAGAPCPAISDGISIMPTLTGSGRQPKSNIYVEYSVGGGTPKYTEFPASRRGMKRGQMQVIREGKLKAIRYNIKTANDPFMVFDVTKDPQEKNNLTGKPGIPKQAHWLAVAARYHGTNPSAKRPFDGTPIPSVSADKTKPGLLQSSAKSNSSYAIDVTGTTSTVKEIKTNAITGTTEFSGYLEVSTSGKHTFSVKGNAHCVLHIHKIL
ncbi:MAG: sulfatase-like hydrolase/transferase, partial [Akkermansiaceae bacterium]